MIPALILLVGVAWAADPPRNSTLTLVPLERLAAQFAKDVERIEVFYPKQFERLEMDWTENVRAYLAEFERARSVEDKLHVFARFHNSWHNAHHRPITVRGFADAPPPERLSLPIRVFGQGLKLSGARFFIIETATNVPVGLAPGDEIVEYDGVAVKDFVRRARDEFNSESPESILESMGKSMALQKRCYWGKRRCWQPGDSVSIGFKRRNGTLGRGSLVWKPLREYSFPKPAAAPQTPPSADGWTFTPLHGSYGYSFDDTPDGEYGFFGELTRSGRRYFLIKIFSFQDNRLVQAAIREANKLRYDGVILDFGDNGGGDDSAMTLLGGLLGPSFHLELSSVRLVREFLDHNKFKEATFGETKARLFRPLLTSENLEKMSPFTPFGCKDESCPVLTEFSHMIDRYERPAIVPDRPVRGLALVTGRGTCSKTDSIAALFRATKIGPIVGTPAMGSSGTYYFQKDYVVTVAGGALIVTATFTPDFSVASDCSEVQGNPPVPDVPIERTIENYAHYDFLTWIGAAKAIEEWSIQPQLARSCSVEQATQQLRRFGLVQVGDSAPRAAR